MNRSSFVVFILLADVTLLGPALANPTTAPRSLTFKQCYELALRQSEQLQLAQEDITQASARIRETVGAVMPNLEWDLTDTIQDTSGVVGQSGGVGGTLTKRERNESKFVLTQPIFSGFREFSTHSALKAERRALEKSRAKQSIDLMGAVAEAFYSVVLLETQKRDVQSLIKLTSDRTHELHSRVSLGKSRRSEVVSAESQLAGLRSQDVALDGQILSAREDLGFLIGEEARRSLLVDVQPFPSEVDETADVLSLVQNRSDVLGAREAVVGRRYAVRAAKGLYWPRLGLTGEYYTHRPGFQENIDWDLIFGLSVPIYQGGAVKAGTDEASSILRQSELSLNRLLRQASLEVNRARSNLNASIRESKMLQIAFERARQSYDLQVKEYRLGLVNNLDVLQTMNVMQQARQNWDRALLQAKLNWLKLKVVTEEKL